MNFIPISIQHMYTLVPLWTSLAVLACIRIFMAQVVFAPYQIHTLYTMYPPAHMIKRTSSNGNPFIVMKDSSYCEPDIILN